MKSKDVDKKNLKIQLYQINLIAENERKARTIKLILKEQLLNINTVFY